MEAQMQMQIPVFNGEDHVIWSIKMRTLLMARDLWDVVETEVPDEKLCQYMEESAQRQKDLRIKDMTALHMLQMSVTDSIFIRIGRATSSKQAWEILKKDFGETEVIQARKRLFLHREFSQLVMKNDESFHEFTEKFMDLVNRLKFYGDYPIPDNALIVMILKKLPPRFSEIVFKSRLEHRVTELTLTEVLYILREAECRSGLEEVTEAPHNNKTSKSCSNKRRRR